MTHLHQLLLIQDLKMPQVPAKSAYYTDNKKTLTVQWQCDLAISLSCEIGVASERRFHFMV